MIAAIGYFVQQATEACGMEIEGGSAPSEVTTASARVDQQADKVPEKPVNSFAHNNVVGRSAMMFRQSLPEIMVFRITVHPYTSGCLLYCGDSRWRWAEYVFVCARGVPRRDALVPAPAFGSDKGHGGRKAVS